MSPISRRKKISAVIKAAMERNVNIFMIDNNHFRSACISEEPRARAVTGRRCPHSGKGEDFLTRQPDFFTETAVTLERKVEKSFPRLEINRHAEG